MNKFVFDLLSSQPNGNTKFHGGGEYTKTIFRIFQNKYGGNANIYIAYNPDKYIDEWIKEFVDGKKVGIIEVRSIGELSDYLYKNMRKESGVFFEGNITEKMIELNIPDSFVLVGTYHGPRWMELKPQSDALYYSDNLFDKFKSVSKFVFRNYYNKKKIKQFEGIFEKFDYLIGVSEHSKYSLQIFYPQMKKEKSLVFYSPIKYVSDTDVSIDEEKRKFVLMLGGNRSIKNVRRGIKALDELFSQSELTEYSVVVVGKVSNTIKRKIKNRERFSFFDNISTAELEMAYKRTDLFLYPTLNEGFGIPPLEAMKYGKTCVVSANSAITEIYGDSVYYINPYDIHEIKTRVIEAAEKKIELEKINSRLKYLFSRQKQDTDALCDFIYSSKKLR